MITWYDGGCVIAVVCKYAACLRYDADRVVRVYGECVRDVCPTIAVDTLHIRFSVMILPFAAAIAVLGMVTLS